MNRIEWTLVGNLLDSFDRLYDGESGVVDTYALLEATGRALPMSDLAQDVVAIAEALLEVVRSGIAEPARRVVALDLVQSLREKVAARWDEGWFEFRPRVRAEFQNVDALGRVRMDAVTTRSDLEAAGVHLVRGLALVVHEPNKVEATGVAEWSEEENTWVVRLGPVRHVDGSP